MGSNNGDITKCITYDILNESTEPGWSRECCIYNVPQVLRKENVDAYTPHLISIGPIHYGNATLMPMEKQKSFYFKCFREKLSDEGKRNLEEFVYMLGDDEEQIRKCYSEKYTNLEKRKFVRMILLDAVFIMELFLRKKEEMQRREEMQAEEEMQGEDVRSDYLFTTYIISKTIERDLLLVENQIPFAVLEELYRVVPAERKGNCPSFLHLARKYFQAYDPYHNLSADRINREHKLKQRWDQPKHFIDLIRYFFVPEDLTRDVQSASVIKTAKKLKMVGITFDPVSSRCLLDVKFTKIPILYWLGYFVFGPKWFKACLQIPILKVDGSTESIIRNLMAFEQCHYPDHHYVCNYVALIGDLIHTEQDVDVLVESKVIVHELGSDKDLSGLINTLCKNIVAKSSYYATLSGNLNEHYHSYFNKVLAQLGLVYLPDLWRITTAIVVFIVLVSWATTIDETLADLLLRR